MVKAVCSYYPQIEQNMKNLARISPFYQTLIHLCLNPVCEMVKISQLCNLNSLHKYIVCSGQILQIQLNFRIIRIG